MALPPVPDSIPELIALYARGADELDTAVRGMGCEQLAARPVTGKWSTIECVCHLSDSEQVYTDRMKRTIAMDRPLIMGFDETRYVGALAYQQRDAAEEIAVVRSTRASMLRVLRTLPATAWERPAVHNEVGLKTLKQFLQTATAHLLYHRRFIDDKRKALGMP